MIFLLASIFVNFSLSLSLSLSCFNYEGTKNIEGIVVDMHMFRGDKLARTISTINKARKYHFEELSDKLLSLDQGNSNEVDLEIDTFAKMHKLKLLQLNYVHFNDNGCYEEFPKKLRWLCWHGFNLKYIPYNFTLQSLVALDLQYSNLEQVWEETMVLLLLLLFKLFLQ